MSRHVDLAMFFATSGHSGVDRVVKNLIPEFSRRGVNVDLIQIKAHGPFLVFEEPNFRRVELPVKHVDLSLPFLVNYLVRSKPKAIFTDKDRVNRTAIIAHKLARAKGRLGVRVGTTVSYNLAKRRASARWAQELSIKYLYPLADTVLTPSSGAAEDLITNYGIPRQLLNVVPSPVLTQELICKSEESLNHPWFSDNIPIILGIGELCSRKDFATLIRAFSRVRKEIKCRLVILGEGKKRAELERLSKNLGVSEDLIMPGFIDNPYPYLANATLFALSSTCEGNPVVLMEALACRTPVVSTDCPSGPREVLQDGRLGELCPVGDDQALAEAILKSIRNPAVHSEELFAAAQDFSVQRSADAYLSALGLNQFLEYQN